MSVHVTRSLVPPLDDFLERLKPIWEEARFTNDGPQVRELEQLVARELESPHGIAVANGTLALQLASAALGLEGEVITTPLSFVATASSLVWMGLTPVFADVHPTTWTLDPERCAEKITPRTRAILATHVYGFPCDVDSLAALAREKNLKLIFDASHTFGCRYRGRPLASYGDIATLSLHATKIFHSAEGGFVCTADPDTAHRVRVQRNFGFDGLESFAVPGINAKLSELHAALALCILPYVEAAIGERRIRFEAYLEALHAVADRVELPHIPDDLEYNYAYFPLLFENEEALRRAWLALVAMDVYPRRYFNPPLNSIPYMGRDQAPVAEALSPRLLCLPLHDGLPLDDVERIAAALVESLA